MAKLYVVGTPIGNLSDMTLRAVETLKSVDFICAEDTRVSAKLLNYFEIKKPLISYHRHNCKEVGEKIITRIKAGENAAIVTDAGMPCISDPGEDLVRECAQNGVEVVVVPGPSAVVSALAISGLSTSRFCFEGFLSASKKLRQEQLSSLKNESRTLIIYEAPHKLLATLSDMLQVFGDRKISLCRELTKIHEEVIRTTLFQAVSFYEQNTPKGEFVLVVEGKEDKPQELTLDEAAQMARNLIKNGIKATEAAKQAAKATGFAKSDIYALLLEREGDA